MSMTKGRTQNPTRKAKKSFTLSVETVAFLERLRRDEHRPSTSLVLEEIILEARRERERKKLEAATTSYYDALSSEDLKEQSEWGEFALKQMPAEPGQ